MAYSYNANGDLTSDGLRTYSYDAEGRLSAVTTGATDASPTTRYAHNGLGQRVFKTEQLYPPAEGDETNPGFMQSLISFFTRMWGPATSDAEKQGFAFMYDEDGTLLAETGTGGANSAGSTQYIYLPTANGPMPVAAVINAQLYAVHSDHLNTPRRLTTSNGQAVWQWSYSAFGDTKPTTAHNRFADLDVTPNPGVTSFAEFVFNLRWPGQYYDKESSLLYNYFRSYSAALGRYLQGDPLGLYDDLNRFGYVHGNPLRYSDPLGLMGGGSPQGRARGAPNVNSFGCMGLACVTGGMEPTSMSAELTLGGGIEICDPPPPPTPEPDTCRKNDWGDGMYGTTQKPQVQPPGIPVPKKLGTPFFSPGWKMSGQFCLRIGVFGALPFPTPSVDLGSLKN